MSRTALPLLLMAASALAQSPGSFDTRIRPVLVERCAQCHSGETKLSGFDITSRAALLQGGKHGVDLIPGKPEESRLYQWAASGKMPPARKLEPSELEALKQWIAEGAPWGADESIASKRPRAGLDWWALQSPRRAAVPENAGITNPIDAFVLQKLRSKGLEFAPAADNRTLIRRVTFDMHGLPPRPEDLKQSYEETVERLLASPHYGERWGRHWLDIVRFGETDGGEHNNERFTAWKYRDYVIQALNADKPYTDFIRDQIAGDVIAPGDPKRVAATGFLVCGPWDSVTKMINKDELMRKTIRQDELDDMVTTTFATFQGLTVNCARCHDHKFDPIPTRDYYRLTAVFNGAGLGEREIATPEEKAARDRQVAPIRKELDAVRKKLGALEDPVRTRLLRSKYEVYDREHHQDARRMPINPIYNRNNFTPVNARHFRFVVLGHTGKIAAIDRLELLPAGHVVSSWTTAEKATPDKPAFVTVDFDTPKTVAEIRWSSDAANGSRSSMVNVYRFEASDDDGSTWKEAASSLNHQHPVEMDLPDVTEAELMASLASEALKDREVLSAQKAELEAKMKAVPPLEGVHAVKPEKLTASYVLKRGSVGQPDDEITPGTLSAVRQLPSDVPAPADNEGARRLALANWIADPKNPLTARVIVNRVWQLHFGNGLVNTPSDFGFNGDRPSHPELLDYLAVSFMENGWSLKWLHRQILTSRTYRQSAAMNEKAHAIDAGNRLLWHMPLKRMDAEMLRDTILSVTNNLNLEAGGPSFLLQKKGDRGSYMHKALDNDGPEVWRRAVYRFVVRGGERVFMDSFDCPDPAVATPQRSVSNTPIQALTLMNNKFALRQADLLAARLQKEAGTDARAQIRRAYKLLFQRGPSENETALGLEFISRQSLPLYTRVLLNSNEFVYVP